MSLYLKAATALAIATLLSAPALAATAPAITASLSNAAKADMVPIAKLTHIVGVWRSGDLKMFDKATSIKVFDAKMLYQGADLKKLASVESHEAKNISHIRSAIKGDAGLDAWFTANNVDVNRIIAVSTPKGGTPEVVLY